MTSKFEILEIVTSDTKANPYRVRLTTVGPYTVSTICLDPITKRLDKIAGLFQDQPDGYETVVVMTKQFENAPDECVQELHLVRYYTLQEATSGHAKVIDELVSGELNIKKVIDKTLN